MAGSAGSPPGSLTVWACVEGCNYARLDRSTGVHVTTDPAQPRGALARHRLEKVEYVPRERFDRLEAQQIQTRADFIEAREQSDALADRLASLLVWVRESGLPEADTASVVTAGYSTLAGYREATAGECGDG